MTFDLSRYDSFVYSCDKSILKVAHGRCATVILYGCVILDVSSDEFLIYGRSIHLFCCAGDCS